MPKPHSEAARAFGERVRTARVDLSLSQETVADLADMHVTNYGKIERGVANPSLHTIIRISSVLSVDPGSLLVGFTGDMLPPRMHTLTAAEFMRERNRRTRSKDD